VLGRMARSPDRAPCLWLGHRSQEHGDSCIACSRRVLHFHCKYAVLDSSRLFGVTMEGIKAYVQALPDVAAWPEIAAFIERAAHKPRPDWELPSLACRAVGGDVSLAIVGAAAIACMQASIILVDDILDDDPRGEHLRSGSGPTANLALGFQAVAFRLVEQMTVSPDRRAAITSSLGWLAFTTALGQHWDVQNLMDEESYWKVVRAKSTPFYGAALHIGALLGGAEQEAAAGLRNFGVLMGEIVQICDDLSDAFQTPANPDWGQGRNNLAILYARTAGHPDRARFIELSSQTDDPQALRAAQRILIRCGAVSYCVYQILRRYQRGRQLLDALPLADPSPMMELLSSQRLALVSLLKASGAEIPLDLSSASLL